MVGELDSKDKNESRIIVIVLIVLFIVLCVGIALMLPMLSTIMETSLSPGLGLKDSAVISFFVTIVLMVLFAITSGDGLIGEIQFVLSGFFVFFTIIWLLIAWVF